MDQDNKSAGVVKRQQIEALQKQIGIKGSLQYFDTEVYKLINELQMHQMELELKNEELIKAKDMADAAREKYAELYDFAPAGYFTLSKDNKIVELNLFGSQMLGKERSQLINTRFDDFVSEKTRPIFNLFYTNLFERRVSETCEIILSVNERDSMNVKLTGIINNNGDQYLLTALDITDRIKAEEILLRSRLMMKSSIDSQKDTIVLAIDQQYRYLYFNTAHYESMKYAYNQSVELGMNILDCITSFEDREIAKQNYDRALRGESHSNIRIYGDSELAWYESFFNPILNEKNEIIGATALARNITGRMQAEAAQVKSELLLNKTQEIAHLGSWELDVPTGQSVWSDEVYRIFGLYREEFPKITIDAFIEMVHPEDREAVYKAYSYSINEDQEGYAIGHRIIKRDTGELRFVHEKCSHLRDTSGKIIRSVGMVQDITELRQTTEALRLGEEKYRLLAENISDVIWTFDLDKNKFTYISPSVFQLRGFTESEAMAESLEDAILSEFRKKIDSETSVRITDFKNGIRNIFVDQVQQPCKDGSIKWVEISSKYLYTKDGTIEVHGVSRDISKRKNAEKELVESRELYRDLIELAVDGVLVGSNEGIIINANSCLCSMLRIDRESLIGTYFGNLIYNHESMRKYPRQLDQIEPGVVVTSERNIMRPDGTEISIEIRTKMMPNGTYQSIFRDITRRKRAIAEMKRKNSELQQINAEKDKYFSIIAHDLRNPLSGFLGLTELMSKGLHRMTLKEINEITVLMSKSATNLFRLLSNLLEWSRMQRGLIKSSPSSILLMQEISESLEIIVEGANYKNIKIQYDIPADLKVFSDINMLNAILRNLVSNAVKFTPKGGDISISAGIVDKNLVRISIKDTGIGMNKQLIDNLFRLDLNTNRKGTDGELSSGLGLMICRDFIQIQGGNLWAESKEGIGSTFHFTLPHIKPTTQNGN